MLKCYLGVQTQYLTPKIHSEQVMTEAEMRQREIGKGASCFLLQKTMYLMEVVMLGCEEQPSLSS